MHTIQFVGKTDPGQRRENNEDSLLVLPERRFYAVADGMGGHAAGEVASGMVVSILEQKFSAGEITDPAAQIEQALQQANDEIYSQGSSNPAQRGMGSTATAVHLDENGSYTIGQVGDSRAYLLRGGRLDQITVDHSLVQEQKDMGLLEEGEKPGGRLKNIITRSIGARESVKVDIYQGEYREGDIFLLCSDGFSNEVPEEEMIDVLSGDEALEQKAERCIKVANERDGSDNITVVLVGIGDPDTNGGELEDTEPAAVLEERTATTVIKNDTGDTTVRESSPPPLKKKRPFLTLFVVLFFVAVAAAAALFFLTDGLNF